MSTIIGDVQNEKTENTCDPLHPNLCKVRSKQGQRNNDDWCPSDFTLLVDEEGDDLKLKF